MGKVLQLHPGFAYGEGRMSGAGSVGQLVKVTGQDVFAVNTGAGAKNIRSFGVLKSDVADGDLANIQVGGIIETDVFNGTDLQPGDGLYPDSTGKLCGGYDDETMSVKASVTTGSAGVNLATWQFNVGGEVGNQASVTLVKSGTSTAMAVTVSGLDISVALATAAVTGDVTSTIQDVIDAIEADADANALVRVDSEFPTALATAKTKTSLAGGADAAVPAGQVISVSSGLLKCRLY